MKKIIIIMLFFLLTVGISYAVKDLTLSTSKLNRVEINLAYDAAGKWDADILCYGVILDDGGGYVKNLKTVQNRSELPANVRDKLDDFLKHMSKEFNVQAADEDKETLSETQKQEIK